MRQINKFRQICLALGLSLALAMWQHPVVAHGASAWAPPLASPVQLINPYIQASSDYSAGHRGVDFRVSLGQTILAPTTGQVRFAGRVVNRPVVSIRTNLGEIVEFEPACTSLPIGERVVLGQPMASVCQSDADYRQHCSAMRCLHYSLRAENGYLSPLQRTSDLALSVLLPRTGFSF